MSDTKGPPVPLIQEAEASVRLDRDETQVCEPVMSAFDEWWDAWSPSWDITDKDAYVHEKESCRAAWQACAASEYERGRRDFAEQALEIAELNGSKPGDVIETEGDMRTFVAGMNCSMRRIYNAIKLAATSGTPAPRCESFNTQGTTTDYCTLSKGHMGPHWGKNWNWPAAPPPADEPLPAGAIDIGHEVWAIIFAYREHRSDAQMAGAFINLIRELGSPAQPSGAQGEGLREALQNISDEWEAYLKSRQLMPTDDLIRAIADGQVALAAAREPAAPASGTEGQ